MKSPTATSIGYIIAVLATLFVAVVRGLLSPILGSHIPLSFFYLSIIFSGIFGGFGPGVVATFLGLSCGIFFFLEPRHSLRLEGLDAQMGILVFGLVGVLISLLCESIRRANVRAHRRSEAQRAAEKQAVTFLNTTTDCYYSLDAEWRFTFVNPRAEEFMGFRAAAVLGRNIWEAFPQAIGTIFEQKCRTAAASNTPVYFEWFSLVHPDRCMDLRVFPSAAGLSIFFRDITEQRAARSAIAASEEQLQIVTDALPVLVSYVGTDQKYRFNNARYEEWFGHRRSELRGKHLREVLGDSAYKEIKPHVEQALAGIPSSFDAELDYSMGSPRTVNVNYVPHRDATGHTLGFVALVADITGRKHRENQQRFLVQLNDLTRSIRRPEEILAAVVTEVGRFLHAARCAYGELDSLNHNITILRDYAEGVQPFAASYHTADFGQALRQEAEKGKSFAVGDISLDPRTAPSGDAFRRIDVRSFLVVPLVKESKLKSVFILAESCPRDWTSSEIELVKQVADRTWLAVENAKGEAALRESEQRFRNLANSAPVLIWLSGTDSQRYWFNTPWLDFTGRTLEQEVGDGWLEGIHSDDVDKSIRELAAAIGDRRESTVEYRLRRHDGQYRWLLNRGIPLCDSNNVFTGYIGSCIDITDRKQAEDDREVLLDSERSARSEAEKANRMKDEFLSTLSHELRTPLNAIMGWTTVLRSGRIGPEDLAKGLEVIDRNVRIQAKLIEDLLDMSRIISGKLRLEVQQVRLSNVVAAAIESILPAAEAKQIQLHKVLDSKNDVVFGDPHRLQQVVWNLLSNAIKFTPKEGRVKVVLKRVDSHIEISVGDSGEGIKSDFLPILFDRFRQSDGSTTRRHGGLGLGLAIVKQLVELHGGTVRAESEGEAKGATFTVNLPLAVVQGLQDTNGTTEQETAIAPEPPSLDGIKVLVVDDEPDARELVSRLVTEYHANVETAGSVDEAFERFQRFRPDVLVSDIGMPEKDGYELIRQIRSLAPEAGGEIPAAALTAFARSEDRRRALMAGYQTHVAKPVDPAELITIIASLAGKTRARSATSLGIPEIR